jgi:Flp pilus assembly protein TadB
VADAGSGEAGEEVLMDDLVGFVVILALTATVFGALALGLTVLVVLAAWLGLALLPFVLIGFVRGVRERKAEETDEPVI